jgi:hypothetical protein
MSQLDQLSAHQTASIGRPAIEYAVILSFIAIALMLLTYYLNIDPNGTAMKSLNWIASIGGVFWFVWHFKNKHNRNYLSFGTGVKLSALTGLLTGLLTGIGMYLFMTFIATDYQERILTSAVKGMRDQGLDDAQIQMGMKYSEMFTSPLVLGAFVIFGTLLTYTIVGLVASAIMKKEQAS